jgi:putative serine protease PepD
MRIQPAGGILAADGVCKGCVRTPSIRCPTGTLERAGMSYGGEDHLMEDNVSVPTQQPVYVQPMVDQRRKEPKRFGLGTLIGIAGATAIAAGVFGGTIGGAVGYFAADAGRGPAPTPATIAGDATPGVSLPASGSIAAVAAAVQPAVVQLLVEGAQTSESGSGSGFIISEDGLIVTNHHVAGVAGKNGTIKVVFADGETATGTLVGSNAGYDLAVVKVNASDLPTVPLGSSGNLNVGDLAIALGSPLGLQGTVTTGIVSALDRPVTVGGAGAGETAFISAIQTDAAINPGNSGGPLVDGNGAVIGVNSAIATLGGFAGNTGSIGLGFAIPIDVAKRIVDEIVKTGSSTTPIIGVQLDMTFAGPGGKVAEVTPGGAAADAGLQTGDVITKVNGAVVSDGTALIVKIRANAPGERLELTVERGSQTLQIPVTLGSTKSN